MTEKIDSRDFPQLKLHVNRKDYTVAVQPDTPLLWVIRENLGLTGTKYGCGIAICGACTVLVDGEAVRSCHTLVSDVEGKEITTIEGLSIDGDHPVQKAWIEDEVPQCGYCHSGQIMTAAALWQRIRTQQMKTSTMPCLTTFVGAGHINASVAWSIGRRR